MRRSLGSIMTSHAQATLVNGVSTFSYYQSDSYAGAQYETCSISGLSTPCKVDPVADEGSLASSAACVIELQDYPEAAYSFQASYVPVTTLSGEFRCANSFARLIDATGPAQAPTGVPLTSAVASS
jgi:hypothetical protein